MNLNKAFDQTLKKFRISAKSLSEESGVATQIISDFRRGKKAIHTDNLEKLLQFLPTEAQAYLFSLFVDGNLTSDEILLSSNRDWQLLISSASLGDIEEILRALSNRYSELKNSKSSSQSEEEVMALSA